MLSWTTKDDGGLCMEVCGVDIDFTKSNGFFLNADCMDGMKQFPDKYFDLAIVDPPYGGGASQNVHVERERERERERIAWRRRRL